MINHTNGLGGVARKISVPNTNTVCGCDSAMQEEVSFQ